MTRRARVIRHRFTASRKHASGCRDLRSKVGLGRRHSCWTTHRFVMGSPHLSQGERSDHGWHGPRIADRGVRWRKRRIERRDAHVAHAVPRRHAGPRPGHHVRGRGRPGDGVGLRGTRALQARHVGHHPWAGEVVDAIRGPTDVHVHAATRREVPRRNDRRRRVMDQELPAPAGDQPGACLHGHRRGQNRGAEPDDVRRHAQGAEQRVPALHGLSLAAVRGEPDRSGQEHRRRRPRAGVAEDQRCGNGAVHDQGVRPRQPLHAGGISRLLGRNGPVRNRFASRSRRASRPRSSSSTPVRSTS